jgi:phage terminase large subunit-like protein
MGSLHRVINLIVALILVAVGGGGVVYFYFIDTTWPLWISIVASIVGVEGSSGILEVCWEYDEDINGKPLGKPLYEPSKRRLTWANGAMATTFSAEEPERLRGPQHEILWCDELAAWQYAQDCWDMAMFGLRIGTHPRAMVTTTPKPIPVVRLAPSFVNALMQRYEGTRIGRQELMGEVVEEAEGALWNRDMIADAHKPKTFTERNIPGQ